MENFFSKYYEVLEINDLMSKSGITAGDMVIQLILNRKSFEEIVNILMSEEKFGGGSEGTPTLLLIVWYLGAHVQGFPR